MVFFTTIVNILISLFFLTKKTKTSSLNFYIIFYSFFLFFFGISPLFQYLSNVNSFFGGRIIEENERLELNIIVTFILLFYHFIYVSIKFGTISIKFSNFKISQIHFVIYILIFVSILFFRFYFTKNIVFNYEDYRDFIINLNQYYRFVYIGLQFFLFFLTAIIIYNQKGFKNTIVFSLTVALVLPFSLPRFMIAILFLPSVIIFLESKSFKLGSYFFILFIPFLFNFFNQFRYNFNKLGFKDITSSFLEGHYDNYYNFIILYNDILPTNGNQLLGNLFFFIPRDFFPSKSLGSGPYFSTLANYNYTNVSCNIFAEGFLNFGNVGILLYLFFIAFLSRFFDSLNSKDLYNRYVILHIAFLFYFFLRGDFLTGYYYLTISIINVALIYFLFSFQKR